MFNPYQESSIMRRQRLYPEISIQYGIMPTGSYAGTYFDRIPENYLVEMVRMLRQAGSRYPYRELILEHAGPLADKIVYERDQAFQAELASRKSISEYFGSVGDTLDSMELTVSFVFWIKKNGIFLITFKDDQGHIFTGFHDGTVRFKKGENVTINAIIRNHKEYNGDKQTGLSKIVKIA